MINTLSLSTDMTKLYLVDNGRSIEFDLTSPHGVIIGTLNGQLSVVTGRMPTIHDPGGVIGEDDAGDGSTPVKAKTAKALPPFSKDVKVRVDSNQYAVIFLEKQQALGIIGATDIDIAFVSNEVPGTDLSIISLRHRAVHVRRIGRILAFTVIKR